MPLALDKRMSQISAPDFGIQDQLSWPVLVVYILTFSGSFANKKVHPFFLTDTYLLYLNGTAFKTCENCTQK